MSILIDKSTRLVVQGITGRDGLFHAKKMKEYGTNVVGGTSPGKGGMNVDGIPVFNTMYEAVEQTQANTSIIFVPARFAAAVSTVSAGLKIMSATPSARATMLVKCAVSIGQPSTRGYIPAGVVLTISPPISGKRA